MTTFDDLAQRIRADDVEGAGQLLLAHPELAAQMNGALPGEAFGGLAIGVATRRRSPAMLDLLIEQGADVNAHTDWWAGGFTVLEMCDHDFAPELIRRGATVDAIAASRFGDVMALRTLLTSEPDAVRMRGGDGKTPLHYANSVDIARELLAHGADIDALDVDHESTPAQYHVSERPGVARFLVASGCRADILLASALGDEAIVRRILADDPESIRTRVSDEWFPKRDPRAGGTIFLWTLGRNKSALIVAREKGHGDLAAWLQSVMSPGQLFADLCLLGDRQGVAALREQVPDVHNRISPSDLGLAVDAAFDVNADAVRLMLESGWPVNATNKNGATVLHSAAWHGHANLVGVLLAHGADVNARERQYNATPLDWAAHGAQNSWLRSSGDYDDVRRKLEQASGVSSG